LEALEDRCVPSSTTLKVTSLLDSGPGSLRYEIAQAQSNDTIVFDFGTKKANSTPHTITLTSGELDINKNLTIQGPGAGLLTVTSTGSYDTGSRIFEVGVGTTASLSGMTISNGNGYSRDPAFGVPSPYDGTGGGVLNLGTLTISGCTLSGNIVGGGIAFVGGGAVANFGRLTLSGCTLSNNRADADGGGIYNDSGSTLTISGCTLSGNDAYYTGDGGGIFNAGTLSVSNSTLTGNYGQFGGGIFNEGTATVIGCTLTANTAGQGGGIYNAYALTVSNSVFSSNTPDNIYGPYTDEGGNSFQ
jgi:parallel beta-helix repeat protein